MPVLPAPAVDSAPFSGSPPTSLADRKGATGQTRPGQNPLEQAKGRQQLLTVAGSGGKAISGSVLLL